MSKFLVIKDSREQLGYDFPQDNYCAGTKIEKVDVGDYSIEGLSHLIFLDRKKSTSELSMNMLEERFDKLLKKASKYKYKFLLFEFDYEDILTYPINSGIPRSQFKRIRVKPAFIASFVARIEIEYGIHIIYAGNADRAEKICYNLLKQIYKIECLQKEN
jgi:ERCC4-type nuclease